MRHAHAMTSTRIESFFDTTDTRAFTDSPHVGLSGFFQVYSPVRNENAITENLPTGFDLTEGLFRETEK